MSSQKRKQVILGAYLGGVNHHTAWWDPQAGSQIEFDSFEHTARTAERGKFDFFFLAEGLALRERAGQIFDQDIIGRPDTFTVLASLAAVTEHLGLAGTINATFNEPYELARQFATLDQLSGGRAAWNVVTSFDAFTRPELSSRRIPGSCATIRACGGDRSAGASTLGFVAQ